jgi:DNA-binding cell septation regulator SpoVG
MSDDALTLECRTIAVEVERFQPLLNGTGSCVGFAKVKFKTPVGSISIDNFRLIDGNKGLFVVPPSHKKGEKYYDDVEITEDLHKLMSGAIKKAYQESKKK